MRNPENNWTRPKSIAEVASLSQSDEELGLNLADFLDYFYALVRKKSTKPHLLNCLKKEPKKLKSDLDNAYLAAVAAHLCNTYKVPTPGWTLAAKRKLKEPWFSVRYPSQRVSLLLNTPPAFRERNIFTDVNALARA